ncbi:MAG: hypothetical protein AB7N76_02150 [Planctomycetota bacterium]
MTTRGRERIDPRPKLVGDSRSAPRGALLLSPLALLLSLLAFSLAMLAAPARADADPPSVVIVQDSNGFPGGEKATALAPQKVHITGPNLAVLDPVHGYGLYVDLKKREVFEVDVHSKEYVRREFDYYKKYRDQRNKALADQRDEFARALKRLDDPQKIRELKNEYRKIGGDPENPGNITARLNHFPGDAKQVSVLVDRAEKTVKVEHYIIRENQGPAIFDLWITRDVEVPVDLFRFYRELGTFSAPVTEKLLELKGTIIQCEATLDTGTFNRTFKTRVTEIRHEKPSPAPVFVPVPPWKEHKEDGPTTAPAVVIHCATCGKVIDAKNPLTFREPWGQRRTFPVCSAECRRELVKKLVAEKKAKGE